MSRIYRRNEIKIDIIVYNLSENPIVRALPIAEALQKSGYRVNIFGFSYKGRGVYKAVLNTEIPIIHINLDDFGILEFLRNYKNFLALLKGDITYCFKPLPSTLIFGIHRKLLYSKKLIVDAEDDELYLPHNSIIERFYLAVFRGWNDPNSFRNKLIFSYLGKFYSDIFTTVSSKLQKRYSGIIIPHLRDEIKFKQTIVEKFKDFKCKYNIRNERLIFFGGYPHDHKGFNTIVEAIKNERNFKLVYAGPDHKNVVNASRILKDNFINLGLVNQQYMIELINLMDITPIIQQKNTFTESQMPAKLTEYLALGKLIIGTDNSDIKDTLIDKNNSSRNRGIIIPNAPLKQVTEFLKIIKDYDKNPENYEYLMKNAIKYYKEHLTYNKIKPLIKLIENE